ncbi:MAG: hypothetical protein M1457_01370, partial [bacterium]|nr:hypothetical protein [bacterium]
MFHPNVAQGLRPLGTKTMIQGKFVDRFEGCANQECSHQVLVSRALNRFPRHFSPSCLSGSFNRPRLLPLYSCCSLLNNFTASVAPLASEAVK